MSFSKLPRHCTQNESKSDCLIVIDSDEEDEVIFVNEDGGQTLAQHEALSRPGFLESLQKNNEPEVRSIFNNVVKIPSTSISNPVIIERSLNESPTDGLDEEQIELPNYDVQLSSYNNINLIPEILCTSNSEMPQLGRIDEVATLTPISPKPIIKLAPLSRLVETPFVPLSESVNKLGINYPTNINVQVMKKQVRQKRSNLKNDKQHLGTSPKKQTLPRSPVKSPTKTYILSKPSKSPTIEPPVHSDQSKSNPQTNKQFTSLPKSASTLQEKKAILQKFIPGGNAKSEWSWDHTIRKTVSFINELRKSDCELDIAEEALLQSNIKLNMEFDKLLHKIYKLCPGDDVNNSTPVKKTRYNSNNSNNKTEAINIEEPVKEIQPDNKENESNDINNIITNTIKPQEFVNNEDYKLLYNLLGEVKESAKVHLLNFDPQIPFNEFLPSTLLNWDEPKAKTELLDELMFLENAIEKCSTETEKMCKVSHEKEIFKYETDLDIFKKEFNLDCPKNLLSDYCKIEKLESDVKDEISDDSKKLPSCSSKDAVIDKSINADGTNDDKNVDVDNENNSKKKAGTPSKQKGKKKQPWNKGKTMKKTSDVSDKIKMPEVIHQPDEATSEIEESLNDTANEEGINEINKDEHEVIENDYIETRSKIAKSKMQVKDVKKKGGNKSKAPVKTPKQLAKGKCTELVDDSNESDAEVQLDVKQITSNTQDDVEAEEGDSGKNVKCEPKQNEIIKKQPPKSTNLLISVERINSLLKANELSKIKVTDDIKSTKNLKEEEPKRCLRRKKYLGEARTTRSFVKKCSEVMDDMDQEVVAFLSTSKSDKAKENRDSDVSESDVEDASLIIDESITTNKEKENENNGAENNREKTEEKEEDPSNDSLNINESVEVEESVIQQKSPRKKKKRNNWGYTKRRSKKLKLPKLIIQAPNEPEMMHQGNDSEVKNVNEETSGVELPNDENKTDVKDLNSNADLALSSKDNDKTPNDSPDEASAKESGTIQIISSCFSIDPSMFDNINDNDNFDAISMDEIEANADSSTMQLSDSETMVKDSDGETKLVEDAIVESDKESPDSPDMASPESPIKCEQLISDSPSSPLALTMKSPDLTEENNVDLKVKSFPISSCESPLDFSTKTTLETPERNSFPKDSETSSTQPLNLSSKTNDSQSLSEVIDFSLKNKNIECEAAFDKSRIPVKEDDTQGKIQNSPCNLSVSTPLIDVQTPFKPSKQIFTDPKIKNVKINASSKEIPQTQSDVEIDENFNQPSAPAKENVISEITDILADLTSPSPSESANLNSNASNKEDSHLSASELTKEKHQVIQESDTLNNITPIDTDMHSLNSKNQESVNPEPSDNQMPFNIDTPRIVVPSNNQYPQINDSAMQAQTLAMNSFLNSATVNNFQLQGQEMMHQMLPLNTPQALNMQNYSQICVPPSNMFPYQTMIQAPQTNFDRYTINNQQMMVPSNGFPNMPHFTMHSNLLQEQFMCNPSQFDQNYGNYLSRVMQDPHQLSLRDPRMSMKEQMNINDPRIMRRLSIQSQESNSSDNSDKQMLAFNSSGSNQGYMNMRDPRLAKKLTNSTKLSPDEPFRSNSRQVNHLISEVIKSNNFENFLMTQKGNQILSHDLEDEEEDLNLNRSDFDDWADNDDESVDKQNQNLLRKSIDKLIASNLQDEKTMALYQKSKTVNESYVQTVSKCIEETSEIRQRNKRDSVSSEDSFEEQSGFARNRVIRSPPMVRKKQSEYEMEDDNVPVEIEEPLTSKSIIKNKTDPEEAKSDEDITIRKSTRDRAVKSQAAQRKIISSSDDEDLSSDEEPKKVSPSKPRKKVSIDEYLGRKNDKYSRERSWQNDGTSSRREGKYYQDDDYNPGRTKQTNTKPQNKIRKRVIDSDEDSSPDSKQNNIVSPSKHGKILDNSDNDEDNAYEKACLSDETSDHLKRVSDIRNRKLDGSSHKMKLSASKNEPFLRRTKFLDELPPTDVNKELIPITECSGKKQIEKSHGISKLEKDLMHRDHSPKSTSRVVRKTITTERIVTKRLSNDPNSSIKKIKLCPDKEKKVFVQERITLKVNERSGLNKKGINFKCDALKEGEILKVVGGRLVRVRKKLSESDEEIERERSKLHKSLQIKFKKKTEGSSTIDDNPYNVLSGEGVKSSVLDRDKIYNSENSKSLVKLTDSIHDAFNTNTPPKYHNSPVNQNLQMKISPGGECGLNEDGRKGIKKDQLNVLRSSSIESSDNSKSSPSSSTKPESTNQTVHIRSDSEGSPYFKSSPNTYFKNKEGKNSRWGPKKDETTSVEKETNGFQKDPNLPVESNFNIKIIDSALPDKMSDSYVTTKGPPPPGTLQDIDERVFLFTENMKVKIPEQIGKVSRWDVKTEVPRAKGTNNITKEKQIVKVSNVSTHSNDDNKNMSEQGTNKCVELNKQSNMEVSKVDEVGKKPDSTISKKSDSEIVKRRDMDVTRSSVKDRRRTNSTELEGRSSMYADKRESMSDFRREFHQKSKRRKETTMVRSEWTEVTENSQSGSNRSILSMMQSGEINIWEISHRHEERSWQVSNSQDNLESQWDNRSGREIDRRDQLYSRRKEALDARDREWNRRQYPNDHQDLYRNRSHLNDTGGWDRNRDRRRSLLDEPQEIDRGREWNYENHDEDRTNWSRGSVRGERSDYESQRYWGDQDMRIRDSPQYRDREPLHDKISYRDHPMFNRYSEQNRSQEDQYYSREENYRSRGDTEYHSNVPPMIDRRTATNKPIPLLDVRVPPVNHRPAYQTNSCNIH